jgi:hypothetical protein
MNDSIEKIIEDSIQRTDGQEPKGYYHVPEGDCLFIINETDAPYHAKYMNKWFTVLLAQDDDHIVGVQIKGISELMKSVPTE